MVDTDLSIAVHEKLNSDDDSAYVLSTPVNLGQSSSESIPTEQVPLILTTHMFDLEALRKAECWEAARHVLCSGYRCSASHF